MAVYDRWHKTRPQPGEQKCKEHGKVPTADHGHDPRWQARYRDGDGAQRKKNFRTEAQAKKFSANTTTDLDRGEYVDTHAGKITFEACAKQWRATAPPIRRR